MKQRIIRLLALLMVLISAGCNNLGNSSGDPSYVIVNSLEDIALPVPGIVTLLSALDDAEEGQTILFDESLDGGTIVLSIVGDAHSVLKGEVMGMRDEPSGPVSYLVGYFDRDYGPSALYARKNVEIDASALSRGITLSWAGGDDNPGPLKHGPRSFPTTPISISGTSSTQPLRQRTFPEWVMSSWETMPGQTCFHPEEHWLKIITLS